MSTDNAPPGPSRRARSTPARPPTRRPAPARSRSTRRRRSSSRTPRSRPTASRSGPRPDLHAHRQPDAGGRGEPHRLAGGRRRCAAPRVRAGRDDVRDPQRRRGGRPRRRVAEPVRRHLQPAPVLARQARGRDDVRRRPARPAGVARRRPPEHQALLRRDDPEPAGRRAGHRGRRGGRARGRRPAGRRQHGRHPICCVLSSTGRTSSCTPPRSTSAATAPRSAA